MKTSFAIGRRSGGVRRRGYGVRADQPAVRFPRLVHKDGRYALFVDDAPYLMRWERRWVTRAPGRRAAQGLAGDSVSTRQYGRDAGLLGTVRAAAREKIDYTVTDTLLAQARQHHFTWFCSGSDSIRRQPALPPEWMKRDPEKYQHITARRPAVDSPSPFAEASLDAISMRSRVHAAP